MILLNKDIEENIETYKDWMYVGIDKLHYLNRITSVHHTAVYSNYFKDSV